MWISPPLGKSAALIDLLVERKRDGQLDSRDCVLFRFRLMER